MKTSMIAVLMLLFLPLQLLAEGCPTEITLKKDNNGLFRNAETCLTSCQRALRSCRTNYAEIDIESAAGENEALKECHQLKRDRCSDVCGQSMQNIVDYRDNLDYLGSATSDGTFRKLLDQISNIQIRCEENFDEVIAERKQKIKELKQELLADREARRMAREKEKQRAVAQKQAQEELLPHSISFSSREEIKNLEDSLFKKEDE